MHFDTIMPISCKPNDIYISNRCCSVLNRNHVSHSGGIEFTSRSLTGLVTVIYCSFAQPV